MIRFHRGLISFVFDDGYTAVCDRVVPLLAKKRMPGVFAVSLDKEAIERSEGQPITDWREWLKLKGDKHEIAAHGVTHRDLTTLTYEELLEELSLPVKQLGATTIVYPGGAHDDRVLAAAKQVYTAGRTVKHGFVAAGHNPLHLTTFNFTKNNFSLGKANLLALWAILTDSWLIETYHMVTDGSEDMLHSVPLSDFAAHLNFVALLPIKVVTIREGIRYL